MSQAPRISEKKITFWKAVFEKKITFWKFIFEKNHYSEL